MQRSNTNCDHHAPGFYEWVLADRKKGFEMDGPALGPAPGSKQAEEVKKKAKEVKARER